MASHFRAHGDSQLGPALARLILQMRYGERDDGVRWREGGIEEEEGGEKKRQKEKGSIKRENATDWVIITECEAPY